MSLRGVLDVVLTDPALAQVVAPAGAAELAVTAAPPVQPLVAAALAARQPGAGVPVLVVTAGERDADAVADRAALLRPRPAGRGLPRLGDAAARAAQPPRGHRRPAAGRAARPRPTPRTGAADRRARRAGAQRAAAAGARARRPGAGRAEARAEPPTSRTSPAPCPTPPTPGSSWSRSAASSPSAVACSTSSRPPSRTRCGWSSGATRSTSSATSPRPTSARSTSGPTGCGRRRAASCCSPPRCASGPPQLGDRAPGAGRDPRQAGRGHRRRGHGVARSRRSSGGRDAAAHRPGAPRHARAGLRPGAGAQPRRGPGAHRRGVPRRVLGRPPPRPARRRSTSGASSFHDLAEVADAARSRGLPWWTTGVFTLAAGRRRRRT